MQIRKFIISLFIVSLSAITVDGQRHQPHAGSTARTPQRSERIEVCSGKKLPAGFVVIALQHAARCESELLVLKKPAKRESVCDISPVPEGYSIVGRGSLSQCVGAESNPLTNAMTILRDDASADAKKATASQQPDQQDTPAKSPEWLDQIQVGMTKAQVTKLWGKPEDTQKVFTNFDGDLEKWRYFRKGTSVYVTFKEGVVSIVEIAAAEK